MAKDFDSFFKELIQERVDEIPCPHHEDMAKKIIKQVKAESKKEKRDKFLKRLKPSVAICIIIAFMVILYAIPETHLMALTRKIIKNIIVVTEDTIKIYKKVDPNSSDKNDDYLFGREIDDPRIGEAQKKIHFRLFIPGYIPEYYELENVDVLNKYEEREAVTFLYLKTDSDKKEYFEITQQSFPKGADVTLNIKKGKHTKIENLTIDETEYTLISNGENLNGILWDTGNIGCEISGNLTRDEIIEVAKSMK